MKLSDYLKDKALFLVCDCLIICGLPLLLVLLAADITLILFFVVVLAAGTIVPLVVDYMRRNRFYSSLLSLFDSLENKNLISEVMEKPPVREGMFLYDMLKTANRDMLEKIAEYRYAQEEYREYIEMWVHEIKTPLAASKLALENHKDYVATGIEEDVAKMEELVEQVLFYSRSNTVEKDYMLRKADVQDIVFSVARKNAQLFIEKHIRLETDVEGLTVFTDVKWIEFILNQLIVNAIKYSDKSDAYVRVTGEKQKDRVILQISDNGTGIPSNELGRVFDKGFTGSNGRKSAQSTGLGLYLCKKLCMKLGHGIGIKSREGEGTTVTIVFPKSSMMMTT
ncbi:MAG: sensor histidine kinase [Christensenella sp.]|uniref:sensor histidine kinase n=1 Tax=Christensenella sp. TaxID=1935934 RepID=UPI002B213D87|nr:sensor histidine kinase [Christensenella sp.]MEA5002087.1 sensor histidine kinase [Christensenella sp.]